MRLESLIMAASLALMQCSGSSARPRSMPAPPPSAAPSAVPTASTADEKWRDQPPAPGAHGALVYPVPESVQLPSGIRVLVVRRPAGVVALSVVARRGPASMVKGKSGLVALMTRLLTEGTRQKTSLQLAEAAEGLGAELGAATGRDQAEVSLTVLPQDLEAGMKLLAEVVQRPAFSADELLRVRGEWLDRLIAERQSPERLATLAGLRWLLGDELGLPVNGTVPEVERLRGADFVAHYPSVFDPTRVGLVVVGDVSMATVEPLARRLFAGWKQRAKPEPPPPARGRVVNGLEIAIVDRPGAVQSALFVAQPWPERQAAGHELREVLATVLGGTFTSRLNRNLREQHAYTYGVGARAVATRFWGALLISTSVKTEHTAPAIEQILLELEAGRDPRKGRPFTAEEVERAKAALLSSLGADLESVGRVADDMGTLFTYDLPLDYFATYGKTLAAITREAVEKEAAERLVPERLLIVVVGDRKQIDAALRPQFPKLQILDAKLIE